MRVNVDTVIRRRSGSGNWLFQSRDRLYVHAESMTCDMYESELCDLRETQSCFCLGGGVAAIFFTSKCPSAIAVLSEPFFFP